MLLLPGFLFILGSCAAVLTTERTRFRSGPGTCHLAETTLQRFKAKPYYY